MDKAVSIQSMFTDAPFYERFGRAGRAGFEGVEPLASPNGYSAAARVHVG